jgi:hemolysin III
MAGARPSQERPQSLGEEIANSVSHGIGVILAVTAAPILVYSSIKAGGTAQIVGAVVFSVTLILLYTASTLYHSLPRNKAKKVFHILDHNAIFLLIAGTYTPFTLGVLRGTWGWTLFGLVWGLAVVGIVLKSVGGIRYRKFSTAVYLIMGWLIIVAAKPLWQNMPSNGLFWLLAGGVVYTTGVGFYAANKIRYTHFIWHVFVIMGTICHFIAVLNYAA